jgi:hypothetical protein
LAHQQENRQQQARGSKQQRYAIRPAIWRLNYGWLAWQRRAPARLRI